MNVAASTGVKRPASRSTIAMMRAGAPHAGQQARPWPSRAPIRPGRSRGGGRRGALEPTRRSLSLSTLETDHRHDAGRPAARWATRPAIAASGTDPSREIEGGEVGEESWSGPDAACPGAPLLAAVMLCGLLVGTTLARVFGAALYARAHRLYESEDDGASEPVHDWARMPNPARPFPLALFHRHRSLCSGFPR